MTQTRAIVFIHGILSSSDKCFQAMVPSINGDERFAGWGKLGFDYDYHQKIETSAAQLVKHLRRLDAAPELLIVAHSMGGLVARRAILSGELPNVRKLIMLGTPNFGACRTSRSPLLMQAALLLTGHVSSVFRKPGILELTRVTDVMKDAIATGAHHADDVEYVTVAGTFFNQSRSLLDVGQAREWRAHSALFKSLEAGVELSSLIPLWRPAIDRPHDGIVERNSCALEPTQPGKQSEKNGTIENPSAFGRTYIHVFHKACDDLMHVTIQGHAQIIEIVKALLLADSLVSWRASLDRDALRWITVTPQFH